MSANKSTALTDLSEIGKSAGIKQMKTDQWLVLTLKQQRRHTCIYSSFQTNILMFLVSQLGINVKLLLVIKEGRVIHLTSSERRTPLPLLYPGWALKHHYLGKSTLLWHQAEGLLLSAHSALWGIFARNCLRCKKCHRVLQLVYSKSKYALLFLCRTHTIYTWWNIQINSVSK